MMEAAVAQIKASLQEELAKSPEVLTRLVGMVDAVTAEMREKQ